MRCACAAAPPRPSAPISGALHSTPLAGGWSRTSRRQTLCLWTEQRASPAAVPARSCNQAVGLCGRCNSFKLLLGRKLKPTGTE